MNYLDWIEQAERISSRDLTVRAQTLDPSNNGELLWDLYFPRKDVDTLDYAMLTTVDSRPVADRRELNAPGRYIPIVTPNVGTVSMIPIEGYHIIDEKEMIKLRGQSRGNQQVFRDAFAAPVPARADVIVQSNFRRLEVDAMNAWANGSITHRNPQLANTTSVSFNFDAARYVTAATAWNDAGVNALTLLLAFCENAIAKVGPIRGVQLARAKLAVILADGPPSPGFFTATPVMAKDDLEALVAKRLGIDSFTFFVDDRFVDIYGDAGTIPTSTRVWPTAKIAAVPMGPIGETAFAPVVRAMDFAAMNPMARIDERGQALFWLAKNDGKSLELQGQLNAMSVPNEQKVYVENVGF